jgi:hypothetical protein
MPWGLSFIQIFNDQNINVHATFKHLEIKISRNSSDKFNFL